MNSTIAISFSPQRSLLFELPVELQTELFLWLDLPCIRSCRDTCRYFREVIDGSAAIQYMIELAQSGYEGRPSGQCVAERREVLARHRAALNNLEWHESNATLYNGTRVEFSAGTYASGNEGTRSLYFVDLPSFAHGTPARNWEHEDIGVDMLDFCIDQNQDLLLIIENPPTDSILFAPRVHVRSLHTAGKYPRATKSILDVPPIRCSWAQCTPRIFGDMFGVLFEGDEGGAGGTLIVWNYIHGNVCWVLSSDWESSRESFTFLDSHLVLVTRNTRGTPPILACIDFYQIDPTAEHTAKLIGSYHLPPLLPSIIFSTINIRSDPGYNYVYSSATPGSPPQFPFQIARDNSTIVVNWAVSSVDLFENFRIFIRAGVFLEIAFAYGVDFAWEQWGTQNTRLFQNRVYNETLWEIHGSRFILPAPSYDDDHVSTISILDFTPHTGELWTATAKSRPFHDLGLHCIARADMEDHRAESFYVSRNEPTSVVSANAFGDRAVVTSLPYCVASRHFDIAGNGVHSAFCDDERIVCLSNSDQPNMVNLKVLAMA